MVARQVPDELRSLVVPARSRPPAGRGLPVRCPGCMARGMTEETGWHSLGCDLPPMNVGDASSQSEPALNTRQRP